MRDPFRHDKRKKRRNRLLALDSAIDTGLWSLAARLRRGYQSYSDFMWRFRVRGSARVATEVLSEGASLGVAAALVVLAFAIPAFYETRTDWRSQVDYSVTFLDRYGNEIGKRGVLHNDSVGLDEMPDHLIRAVLATEDRRFYSHFGIDIPGTLRAVGANARASTVVQGGSSITQQLAKNLFLSSDRTLERKIKEAFLALWLEARLSKNEILKLYLDRAYMGGGTFGVEAAAEFYFGKSARDVTLAEAAMLAGLFKAPTRYAPHVNLPAARGRANEVLTNLVQAGFMTEGEIRTARRRPAEAVNHDSEDVPNYFLDWVFAEAKAKAGDEKVLTVKTTIDPDIQRSAELAIKSHLRQYGQEYDVDQGAMVVMEPGGAVRAMVGGRDYGESQFNRATNALRQPGSSFKTYVYATALMNGYTPDSRVSDAPISIGGWSPQNYNRSYAGQVDLTTALARSINTIPVRLSQAIGRDKIAETAHAMGVESEIRITRSLALGPSEVTVLDQAAGYATLANGGKHSPPFGVSEIVSSASQVIHNHGRDTPAGEQVLPPAVTADLNRMLNRVVEAGTGRRAQLANIKAAGKTGTSQSYRDGWFIGHTGNYVASVWFGNDDFSPMNRLTGGSVPAMVWQKVMAYAHQGVDIVPIPGVAPFESEGEMALVAAGAEDGEAAPDRRPVSLSSRSTRVLSRISERLSASDDGQARGERAPPGDDQAALSAPRGGTGEAEAALFAGAARASRGE